MPPLFPFAFSLSHHQNLFQHRRSKGISEIEDNIWKKKEKKKLNMSMKIRKLIWLNIPDVSLRISFTYKDMKSSEKRASPYRFWEFRKQRCFCAEYFRSERVNYFALFHKTLDWNELEMLPNLFWVPTISTKRHQ